jgi:haloalkane dehalogenase
MDRAVSGLVRTGEASMISAAFPYQKRRRRVLGSDMAYVEAGEGDPHRGIAPDLIGMGDSDKLPDSGPGSYRFVEQRRYLDAFA